MPFAIIEIVKDDGKNKLFVVPDKWLRSSRNGSIALWPNCDLNQEQYFRDESVCPQKSWQKYKCTVKKYPISAFEQAQTTMEAMLDPTKQISSKALHSADGELVGENPSDSRRTLSLEQKVDEDTIEVKEEKDKFPVIISAHSGNTENSFHRCLDKMDEILGLQHLINARLDKLEVKLDDVLNQNKSILNASKSCCKGSSNIEETLSFIFEPIDSEQKLIDLETRLEDCEYRTKLIRWLRLNVSGDCTEDRMLGVLDALFTKKFQTMCTWTGISRKGPKTAVMPNRNILEIFQIIGSGDSEVVSQRELANFFMKKLKNSLKRLQVSGVRRPTRHIRRRRINVHKQADNQENNDESGSHSEAEHESYPGYIEDSGSSDGTSAVYSVEIPSTSENNLNDLYVVKME